jgi:hypothetical protein
MYFNDLDGVYDEVSDVTQEQFNFLNERISKVQDKFKRNKFYVGADSVFARNWGHPTLEKAIEHASTLLNGRNEVFIVKIVKVVRKKVAPIEVVDVK